MIQKLTLVLFGVALATILLAADAKPLDFVMRFKGSANARTGTFSIRAPSQHIETVITPKDAVRFDVKESIGSHATINGHDTAFSNGTFTTVGKKLALYFIIIIIHLRNSQETLRLVLTCSMTPMFCTSKLLVLVINATLATKK
jgi:hypothetical protein